MAKFLRISKRLAGPLFIIASGLCPNLALGGGEEFHVSGIVYSIVWPHSVEVKDRGILWVPGLISVVEDKRAQIRSLDFSTADEQEFSVIRSIHEGNHVTIDGAIEGNVRRYFTIRVDH